ncbi:MAG: type II toxin-antitoxin system RatA family toxin, partial [Gammaproteobacteria bacterium]
MSKSAVVPYTADQMYHLVNDIESYPQFLPWCTDAVVHDRTDESLTATVSLATGKLQQSFTTENRMRAGERIDVNLVKGPFKYLRGHWTFRDIDQNNCQVELEMEFEFRNKLLKLTLSAVFGQFMNALVGSF